LTGSVYAIPCQFDRLDGWAEDDHAAALHALANAATREDIEGLHEADARAYFESRFEPFTVPADTPGFVTGYYEPELRGSLTKSRRFSIPIHARPADLVTTINETDRAAHNDAPTGFRVTSDGMVPYFTRAEIEAGALDGRGLVILYTDDPVDLYFMHVQGSGLVHLDDGSSVRLTYAGKNGHPYTSLARVLTDLGELDAGGIDMAALKAWLRTDPERGRALMRSNQSYIFFSVLRGDEGARGPSGAEGVPLTAGRSLAADPAYIPHGTPVFVTVPDLAGEDGQPFRRLMIAQDVGSAIRGPQRGDIFFGTGEIAGALAGRTRHVARFHVLKRKR